MHINELIIRAARGEATDEEVRRLRRWRRESDENERHYRQTTRLVRLVRELDATPDTTPITARTVVQRGSARADGEDEAVPGRRLAYWSRSSLLKGAAAAVLVLALGLAGRWWIDGPSPDGSPSLVVYETGADQPRSIQLDDGSLVHLAPSSRLEVVRGDVEPELRLEGRAFFGVANRGGRRISVETPGGRVTVLGTRFDVRSEQRDLEVLVVSGRVQVGWESQSFEVGAGSLSVLRTGTVQSVDQVEDPLDHLDWMGRAMVFQATPLDDVAREIERRYDADIEILDAEAAERTLTTAFDGEPFEQVMNVVCNVVQVECTLDENRATVRLD